MSENTNRSMHDDVPRMEPWLGVCLLAFVPVVGLFILPPVAAIPLYLVMAVLMTTGIGMFLRSEARRKKNNPTST